MSYLQKLRAKFQAGFSAIFPTDVKSDLFINHHKIYHPEP
jgi:hypothetical protein